MTSEGAGGDPLTDAALQSEIELVGDLVAAASESEGPMGEHELDRVLGVPPEEADEGRRAGTADASADTPAQPEPGEPAAADRADGAGTEGEPGHGQRMQGVV